VTPSREASTRTGRRRPFDQVSCTSATATTAPRSTTIRPDGPGRHAVRGSPSTARAGALIPAGSGEVGNVVRPRARSAVGVTGAPGTVTLRDRPADTRIVDDQDPARTVTTTLCLAGAVTVRWCESATSKRVPSGTPSSTVKRGGSTSAVPPARLTVQSRPRRRATWVPR
jgi:hypothetical protein